MPSPKEQLTRALRVAAEPETPLSAPGEALLAAARRRDRVRRTLAPAAAAAAVVLVAAGVTVGLHPVAPHRCRPAVGAGSGGRSWRT